MNKSLGWQSEMSGFFAVREIKSLLIPSALCLVNGRSCSSDACIRKWRLFDRIVALGRFWSGRSVPRKTPKASASLAQSGTTAIREVIGSTGSTNRELMGRGSFRGSLAHRQQFGMAKAGLEKPLTCLA